MTLSLFGCLAVPAALVRPLLLLSAAAAPERLNKAKLHVRLRISNLKTILSLSTMAKSISFSAGANNKGWSASASGSAGPVKGTAQIGGNWGQKPTWSAGVSGSKTF